jgi:RNA polymerase sigma-70 factor (ECF subfamily)
VTTPEEDFALISRLRGGDFAAARDLYDRHCAALYRFAVAMTGRNDVAEDAMQDAFVELLERPERFDPTRGALVSYLLGITRHRLASMFRKSTRAIAIDPLELDQLAAEPGDDEAERAQESRRLRAAIFTLPWSYRAAVVLCDLEELDYAEVAGILECPIGTVRSRLHRARALLAERLAVRRAPIRTLAAPQSLERAITTADLPLRGWS